jgi:hypothetical protein
MSQTSKRGTQSNSGGNLVPYAYHEAGHAVVGHLLGRCLERISILADKRQGYRGYCRFSSLAEAFNDHPEWHESTRNPALLTIFYAGPVATSLICRALDWEEENWRGAGQVDLVLINCLVRAISGDKRERAAVKRAHHMQAEEMIVRYWKAVEELALALLEQGWLSGREAHQLL